MVPSQEQVVAWVTNFEGQEEEKTLSRRQREIAEEPLACILLSQNTLYRHSPLYICEFVRLVGRGNEPRKRYRLVLGLPPIAGFMSVIRSYCISLSASISERGMGKRTNCP